MSAAEMGTYLGIQTMCYLQNKPMTVGPFHCYLAYLLGPKNYLKGDQLHHHLKGIPVHHLWKYPPGYLCSP